MTASVHWISAVVEQPEACMPVDIQGPGEKGCCVPSGDCKSDLDISASEPTNHHMRHLNLEYSTAYLYNVSTALSFIFLAPHIPTLFFFFPQGALLPLPHSLGQAGQLRHSGQRGEHGL